MEGEGDLQRGANVWGYRLREEFVERLGFEHCSQMRGQRPLDTEFDRIASFLCFVAPVEGAGVVVGEEVYQQRKLICLFTCLLPSNHV